MEIIKKTLTRDWIRIKHTFVRHCNKVSFS